MNPDELSKVMVIHVGRIINSYWMRFFSDFRKNHGGASAFGRYLIIPDITKTKSNNCFILSSGLDIAL